jgi:hypothetical protein
MQENRGGSYGALSSFKIRPMEAPINRDIPHRNIAKGKMLNLFTISHVEFELFSFFFENAIGLGE